MNFTSWAVISWILLWKYLVSYLFLVTYEGKSCCWMSNLLNSFKNKTKKVTLALAFLEKYNLLGHPGNVVGGRGTVVLAIKIKQSYKTIIHWSAPFSWLVRATASVIFPPWIALFTAPAKHGGIKDLQAIRNWSSRGSHYKSLYALTTLKSIVISKV